MQNYAEKHHNWEGRVCPSARMVLRVALTKVSWAACKESKFNALGWWEDSAVPPAVQEQQRRKLKSPIKFYCPMNFVLDEHVIM